jgi:diguanylate cyclase (GGDEF)-like protein
LSGDAVIGVLSLYSSELNAFTDDHKRIIEAVGRQIAHTLERASEFDVIMRRDELTGLPSITQLERIVVPAASGKGNEHQYSLLFIDVTKLDQASTADGSGAADDVLRHVVRHIRSGLRVADILFRKSSEEFVAFLSDTDAATAEAVAQRVVASIVGHPITLATGNQLRVEVSVRAVCCPRDGHSLDALLRLSAPRITEKDSGASTTRVH